MQAYFVAWFFDLLTPLFCLTLIALIAYPPARTFLFPPAPLALVNAKTGGVQKPEAGVLGSHDSVTGAPENFKGEAVEQEASNFVNRVGAVILTGAVVRHPEVQHDDGSVGQNEISPAAMATEVVDSTHSAAGGKSAVGHDKTKEPMEAIVWGKMRPAMRAIATVSDSWERIAKSVEIASQSVRDVCL